MTRIVSLGILMLLAICQYVGSAAAAVVNPVEYLAVDRPDYALGFGFDYESGDYGVGNQSDFISLPFYLDLYPTDRIDVGVVIPYLYQRIDQNSGTTIFYRAQSGYVNGTVNQARSAQSSNMSDINNSTSNGNNSNAGNNSNGGNGSSGSSTASAGGSGDNSATAEAAKTASQRVTEEGLGDVTLTIGYTLVKESLSTPLVKPTFYLKLPTADEDKGLGSGEFDFGPGLTLGKWFGNWYLFAEGLYVIQGETSLYDTKDYLSYGVSAGHQIGESLFVSTMARGMTAPAEGSGNLLEGRLKVVWWMKSDISLEGYIGTGLSEHGADFTSSVAVFFNY